LAVVSFLFGVAFMLIFFPGRKNDKTVSSGEIIVDTTEGTPNLYLSIITEKAFLDIVNGNLKKVTFDVKVKQ
jgi:hypothetical protein